MNLNNLLEMSIEGRRVDRPQPLDNSGKVTIEKSAAFQWRCELFKNVIGWQSEAESSSISAKSKIRSTLLKSTTFVMKKE